MHTETRTELFEPPQSPPPDGSRKNRRYRVLVFVLAVVVGAIACFGTILAIFAWTGAGL